MLARLFPKAAGNAEYRGWRAGIWLMVPVAALRLVEGINSILSTRQVAMTADGIPLDTYGPAGAAAVISLFALGGLALVLTALLAAAVLIRYRGLIPFTYVLLLLDVLGTKWLLIVHPIARAGAAKIGAFSIGALMNWGIIAVIVLGLAFSLLSRRSAP